MHRILAAVVILSFGLVVASHTANERQEYTDTVAATTDVQLKVNIARSKVQIEGNAGSTDDEQTLRTLADGLFGDAELIVRLDTRGDVPDHWPKATAQLLQMLANVESGQASMDTERLRITAVISSEAGWAEEISSLQLILPNDVAISEDTIVVSQTSPSTVCHGAFERYDASFIRFYESTDRFRASAYPHLDKLVALADACREGVVQVTGHTDASGNEAANQALSMQRADAVINYLTANGIDDTRLSAASAGSSDPIADNTTRYGRSLNRRVEIELLRL